MGGGYRKGPLVGAVDYLMIRTYWYGLCCDVIIH